MSMQPNVLQQVSPSMLFQALQLCVDADQPLFLWGRPGVGKSNMYEQFAKSIDYGLRDCRASQWDAVDTRGIPFSYQTDDGRTVTGWAPPDFFPTDPEAREIILFDELNTAPQSVQAALYQLFLDRKLGDYVLPKHCRIFAAGNLESDRAITTKMSTALAGRMTHLELMVDHAAWESWAIDADLHLGVISYLRWKKDNLHAWDANSASKAQATPRTWEFTSNLVKAAEARGISGTAVESALIRGTIGDAIGSEFAGFLPMYRQLPDPDGVIKNPMNAPILSDPSLSYALCAAIGDRATKSNFANCIKYAERLRDSRSAGPEFMSLLVHVAIGKTPALQQTAAFIKFASENANVFI